jgi:type III pantothenate kinase
MKVDVVVDVGNSRIKWGRCGPDGVTATVSLPPDDPGAWRQQIESWGLTTGATWALASVQPQRSATLAAWLQERRHAVWRVESPSQLPLRVAVDHPERVGIDRLLDAVAAVHTQLRGRVPAIVVDAGSAVTVDLIDETGTFRGGAIFPGLRLMARSLHDYTALLPLVDVEAIDPLPARSTEQAMTGGIYYAVVGGINAIVNHYLNNHCPSHTADIYVTGGDGRLLAHGVYPPAELWPEMTLEGLRHTAEAQL